MGNLSGVVKQLGKERNRLEAELHRVTAALTAFGKVYMYGSKPKAAVATRKKRTLSVAARRKIAAAQRARWAKVRAAKKAA
jgi:16S rRNA G1207 methylase RsmC